MIQLRNRLIAGAGFASMLGVVLIALQPFSQGGQPWPLLWIFSPFYVGLAFVISMPRLPQTTSVSFRLCRALAPALTAHALLSVVAAIRDGLTMQDPTAMSVLLVLPLFFAFSWPLTWGLLEWPERRRARTGFFS